MTRQLGRLILLSSLACAVRAQSGQQVFEVASVKLSRSSGETNFEGGPGHSNPTRYVATRATLLSLLIEAYGIEDFQISSKASLEKDEYDVAANVPAGATKAQFQEMFQRFLAERFHLRLRKETREFPAYALMVAKSGLKMKVSTDTKTPDLRAINTRDSGGYILVRVSAQKQPASELASLARTWTSDGEPVVDETGLSEMYDFTLEHTFEYPGSPATGLPSAPSLFTALREQLGLELVRKRVSFPYFVVESFDRIPSEN